MSDVPARHPDPRRDLRVSHDDRDRVAEMLRDAAGDGRLDLDELEQRLEQAFAAKTYGELEPLVADLPSSRQQPPTPTHGVGGMPTSTRSQAILSERKRTGAWVVADTFLATAVLGNVELDLRQATFERPEVTISCSAVLGEVKIRVGADVVVIDEVNTILGESTLKSSKGLAPMPQQGRVLRVQGTAFLGSVRIERLGPDDTRLRRISSG